ncbi:hypothetical protein EDF59_120106 [Novosphingobium sp. ST904]|nr:hypothetical protein EDF59_120106 [Novosphingobium sp. ST904]
MPLPTRSLPHVKCPPLSAILLHMAALAPLVAAALIPGVVFA